jgi:hypothetical protein
VINLQISVNDSAKSVALSATTNTDSVSFYRRIGQSGEFLLASSVPVVDGVATIVDQSPPEKTLVTYVAMGSDYERSIPAAAVVPSSWQLSRPTLAGDIRLGTLDDDGDWSDLMVFNTIDDLGTVWTISDIDGWWTLPEAEVPTVARARDEDGSYDDDGRYIARSLTLSGVFLPRSADSLAESRARLSAALNAVRRTISLRVDETPPRRMTVRLSGKTQISTVRQSGLTEFAAELRAADPVKYSLMPMSQPDFPGQTVPVVVGAGSPSGSRTYPRSYDTSTDNVREYGASGTSNLGRIFNEGDYVSPPVVRIDGPVTNPRVELVETGETMEFVISLQTGEYLEIDVQEKTVLLNGAESRRGTMTFQSTFFKIHPGTNTIRYTALAAPGNTTTVSITAYSAWLG